MKKVFLGFFLILFMATIFAGATLRDFRASSEGDDIKVEWETGDENNVQNFIIERNNYESSLGSSQSFLEIKSIQPKGSNSYYSFLDESLFKTNDYVFQYRLKIVDMDGTITYSNTISVTPKISGLKRTWGSIKAMFR
ncbi:MAG: hypothetical protein A2000_11875 [Ignavibacteria bacterium GWB2_36_8]|nr:MAG: hypothetical protein A2000_11875 [Ignavibacteria bacterium GWB2_36_8]